MAKETDDERTHARAAAGAHDELPEHDFEAEHDHGRANRISLMRMRRYEANAPHGDDAQRAEGATVHIQRAQSDAGAPLSTGMRSRFESSLGADLSGVRVHTGSASSTAADAIGAKAYTTGQDIHFGAGEYDPSSRQGRHLLAHEVAHTVQQGAAGEVQAKTKLDVSSSGDAHEHEADRAADAMVTGAPATVSKAIVGQRGQVQRKSVDDNLLTGPGLNPPAPISTGSDLADKGLGCEPVAKQPVNEPCWLDPVQRRHILGEFQIRVTDARSDYFAAIDELRTEELLKKDPGANEWMFDIFLDVISIVGIDAIKSALRAGLGANGELAHLVTDEQRAINELSTITEGHMATILGSAAGKARASAAQKDESERAKADTEKTAALSFLDLLRPEAEQRFDTLRFTAPAGASDGELMVMYRAYTRHRPTKERYRQELEKVMKGFRQSGLAKLGVTKNNPFRGDPTGGHLRGDQDPRAHWQIATAAFWVNTPAGRRLALYQRGHRDVPETWHPMGGGASRRMSDEDAKNFEEQDLRARPYVFQKYVPTAFVNVAVKMHVAKWGSEPEEHAMGAEEFRAMAWDLEY